MDDLRYNRLTVVVVNLNGVVSLEEFQMVEKFNCEVSPHSLRETVLIAGEFAHSVLQTEIAYGEMLNERAKCAQHVPSLLLGKIFVVAVTIQ